MNSWKMMAAGMVGLCLMAGEVSANPFYVVGSGVNTAVSYVTSPFTGYVCQNGACQPVPYNVNRLWGAPAYSAPQQSYSAPAWQAPWLPFLGGPRVAPAQPPRVVPNLSQPQSTAPSETETENGVMFLPDPPEPLDGSHATSPPVPKGYTAPVSAPADASPFYQ